MRILGRLGEMQTLLADTQQDVPELLADSFQSL